MSCYISLLNMHVLLVFWGNSVACCIHIGGAAFAKVVTSAARPAVHSVRAAVPPCDGSLLTMV